MCIVFNCIVEYLKLIKKKPFKHLGNKVYYKILSVILPLIIFTITDFKLHFS